MAMMVLGVLLITIMSGIEAGGFQRAWDIASEAGRTDALKYIFLIILINLSAFHVRIDPNIKAYFNVHNFSYRLQYIYPTACL